MRELKKQEIMVYLAALFLMIIRVDIWWWGDIGEPLLGGWFSIPMLYQFFIWVLGYALVIYTVYRVWKD